MGINREQALDCFGSDDLIGLGMEADAVRQRLHPEGTVTYLLARTLCCTDVAFDARLAEALDAGAFSISLCAAPAHDLAWHEALLTRISSRFPALWLHGFSATAVVAIAAKAQLPIAEALLRLQAAGLRSLAGDDAAVLDDSVPANTRCSVADWLATHRAAHRLGLPSTAALRFGAGETIAQRVNHLILLRDLQSETGGFLSFLPGAQPVPRDLDGPTAVEYLQTLAISRMLLDTLPHVEADWRAQGLKVTQMTLRFGADDLGSIFPGDDLPRAGDTTEEDLRRIIRGAGLRPVQRDAPFRTCILG